MWDVQQHQLLHQHHQKGQEWSCKISLNQLHYLFWKKQATMIMQIRSATCNKSETWTNYLSGNIYERGSCDLSHSMNTGIIRPHSFGFFIDRAGWCKYMFIPLLNNQHIMLALSIPLTRTHCYKEAAPKKTIPWIFCIIDISMIEEEWPLIPGD